MALTVAPTFARAFARCAFLVGGFSTKRCRDKILKEVARHSQELEGTLKTEVFSERRTEPLKTKLLLEIGYDGSVYGNRSLAGDEVLVNPEDNACFRAPCQLVPTRHSVEED
jgi:hypothetical protein